MIRMIFYDPIVPSVRQSTRHERWKIIPRKTQDTHPSTSGKKRNRNGLWDPPLFLIFSKHHSCLTHKTYSRLPDIMLSTLFRQNSKAKNKREMVDNNNGAIVFRVTIPHHAIQGEEFQVVANDTVLRIRCPQNASPGQFLQFTLPDERETRPRRSIRTSSTTSSLTKARKRNIFEVAVPRGVRPGKPFALIANGTRVLVTCPANAHPGQRIRFELPDALSNSRATSNNRAAQIRLKYDKDGWARMIRFTDLRFQWVRVDDNGDIDLSHKGFNPDKSAYARRLQLFDGEDPRLRTAALYLVPADEAVVDSKIRTSDGTDLVSHSDLVAAQMMSYDKKVEWFRNTCAKLIVGWNEGHIKINVRRNHLLSDSVRAIMSLSRRDMRKVWRFDFLGEEGLDAGGLSREWYEMTMCQIFDPDFGLWQSSASNQQCMTINPASGK